MSGVYGVPGEQVVPYKGVARTAEDIAFVCVVTIGEQPPQADDSGLVSRLTQARKPLEELVRWERWEET